MYLAYELELLISLERSERITYVIVAKDVDNISLRATKNRIVKKAIEIEDKVCNTDLVHGDKKIYKDYKHFIYLGIDFVNECRIKNHHKDEVIVKIESILKKNNI